MIEVIKFNDPPKKIDSGMGKIITHDKCKAECQQVIAGIFREIRRLAYPMKPYDNILRIKLERFEALEAKHVKGE